MFKLQSTTVLRGLNGGVLVMLDTGRQDDATTKKRVLVAVASIHLPWQGESSERQDGTSPRRKLLDGFLQQINTNVKRYVQDEGAVVAIIIGGDMNDAFHAAEVAMEAGFRDSFYDLQLTVPPTYPAFPGNDVIKRYGYNVDERGTTTYDWIFSNGVLRSTAAQVLSSKQFDADPKTYRYEFPFFSDHLPVAATYQVLVSDSDRPVAPSGGLAAAATMPASRPSPAAAVAQLLPGASEPASSMAATDPPATTTGDSSATATTTVTTELTDDASDAVQDLCGDSCAELVSRKGRNICKAAWAQGCPDDAPPEGFSSKSICMPE